MENELSLEEQHNIYHGVVDYLESLANRSEDEEFRLKDAKKKRLRAKDKLRNLGRL